jgi:UDP-N-acetylmuramoylalanine--D-glutamate ligase
VVVGLARQGKALVHYLVAHASHVLVTDLKSEGELQEEMAELADLKLDFELGRHPSSLLEGTGALFLSGGVPADIPLADEARKRGIPVSNDAQLFLEETPATVIGITGSAGKTTTASLVAQMAERGFEGGERTVWLGGNIGRPLLIDLECMRSDDLAVIELSSFQLELMESSPAIAAILNLTPDHLDRHGTMENYIQAKKRILQFQAGGDWAILNHDDPAVWAFHTDIEGGLIGFGAADPGTESAAFIDGNQLTIRFGGVQQLICGVDEVKLRGRHNLLNMLAACALSAAAAVEVEAMTSVATTFAGVPHRMEYVGDFHGAIWFNDSIATTPARALAAVRSFDEPIILLLGGQDKALPWEPFFAEVLGRVEHIVLFGEVGGRFADLISSLENAAGTASVSLVDNLEHAVAAAARLARPGMVVLLSPGCTSFDEFANYEARGERFMELVRAL